MEEAASAGQQSKGFRLGFRGYFLIGVLVLIAGALIAFQRHKAKLNHQVAAELARIHASGSPTNTVELEMRYRAVAKTNNAADGLAMAFRAMLPGSADEISKILKKAEKNGGKLEPEEKEALGKFVEASGKAIPLLDKAIEEGPAIFNLQFYAGMNMGVPHLSSLRSAATVLKGRAFLSASEGRNSEAIAEVARLLKLGGVLQYEPLVISQLVRIAIFELGLTLVDEIVATGEASAEELSLLQAEIRRCLDPAPMTLGMAGERAFGIEILMHPEAQLGAPQAAPAFRLLRTAGAIQTELRLYLRRMEELVEATRAPFPAALDKAEAIERIAQQWKGQMDSARIPLPRTGLFTYMMLPGLMGVIQKEGRIFALARMAIVGAEIEKVKARTGEYPASLEELKGLPPEDLVDPFTGGLFRYQAGHSGYLLYSFGPNRRDDGGVPASTDKEKRSVGRASPPRDSDSDLVFKVERAGTPGSQGN